MKPVKARKNRRKFHMLARTVGITKNHMDLPLPVIPKLPQNIELKSRLEKERIIANGTFQFNKKSGKYMETVSIIFVF